MKIAMIGLGRMGRNMAKRLLRGGHAVIAYNRSPEKTDVLVKEEGAGGAYSFDEAAALRREFGGHFTVPANKNS